MLQPAGQASVGFRVGRHAVLVDRVVRDWSKGLELRREWRHLGREEALDKVGEPEGSAALLDEADGAAEEHSEEHDARVVWRRERLQHVRVEDSEQRDHRVGAVHEERAAPDAKEHGEHDLLEQDRGHERGERRQQRQPARPDHVQHGTRCRRTRCRRVGGEWTHGHVKRADGR